ncbi:MAG: hypothetical protein QOJ13_3238 [Gaiellales bacterium]|jgi:hypothetical protein|nr:hypothetical protein [Gaiellales bacterium]
MRIDAATELPELPYEDWRRTKQTLHLWAQIVGKVKLATTAPRNHWWNVPLYVDVRGITTRPLRRNGVVFGIDFDFVDHRLVIRTDRGDVASFPLEDGLSVGDFDRRLHDLLAHHGVDVEILERPFGLPEGIPFPDDDEHAQYQPEYAERFWRSLTWSDSVLDEFSGWFCGKSSPVHIFWHSLDLAVTRFSGRPAPPNDSLDPVNAEAYSHELISFGFWAGDDTRREANFYSYTAPEPDGLRDAPLHPQTAHWADQGAGSLALLSYDAVRASADPKRELLAFLESAYRAGADAAGWDTVAMASSFCPFTYGRPGA